MKIAVRIRHRTTQLITLNVERTGPSVSTKMPISNHKLRILRHPQPSQPSPQACSPPNRSQALHQAINLCYPNPHLATSLKASPSQLPPNQTIYHQYQPQTHQKARNSPNNHSSNPNQPPQNNPQPPPSSQPSKSTTSSRKKCPRKSH